MKPLKPDSSKALESEPSPDGPPLRGFKDPSYVPLCRSLAEIRVSVDSLDQQIIALMAERAMYVKDAARFKASSYQVSAPMRQPQVFEKARRTAALENKGFAGLEDVVEATYRTMVAGFISEEQRYFASDLTDIEK